MICHNSVGYDAQIKDLLIKSAFNMDEKEIDAWMKYQYDPQHMFCFWQDDQITSCLQVSKKNMMFLDQQIRVSVIGMAATLPDYRQRKQFSSLLDAAISQATYNDLFTIAYTNMPKLFEVKSFQNISSTKEYWIGAPLCKSGNPFHIVRKKDNLYPLYFQFMQYFDGSVLLSEEEFNNLIQYHEKLGKFIVTVVNDEKQPKGFAIYSTKDGQAHVETLIYFDSQAIQDLLTYLSYKHDVTSILISENERFDKLFPLHFPRTDKKLMVRLNNYKLFDKFSSTNVRNAKAAYELLEKPTWNHFQ